MDQDSFRQLLQSSSSRATPSSRPGVKQAKTISASEPAFKPRKVKKEAKYRDRAAERRVGGGNDYAQVEAVLEDFNKRTADQGKDVVDAQRGYLGGDSEHTILVKGLDVALLEQNKMKAAASSVDDDTLEKAFLGEVPESTVPKKRTREDIVRELKAKRSKTEDSQQPPATTDAPLPSNKFKPIGFKPIGQSDAEVKKKKKVKNGDGVKKKKRNVELTAKTEDTSQPAPSEPLKDSPKPLPALKPLEPEPELPEDFDIFEGAGEYEGLDVGDDDSDNDTSPLKEDNSPPDDELLNRPGGWFNDDLSPPVPSQSKSPLDVVPTPVPVPLPSVPDEDEEEEADNDRPVRLVPLESSALPSIEDFLLMDQTAGSSEKRRKRKEKNKGAKDAGGEPKKLNAEAKADRDYKKLKSYQDKKAAGKS